MYFMEKIFMGYWVLFVLEFVEGECYKYYIKDVYGYDLLYKVDLFGFSVE